MYEIGLSVGIVIMSLALVALLKNVREFTSNDLMATVCMAFVILIAISEIL